MTKNGFADFTWYFLATNDVFDYFLGRFCLFLSWKVVSTTDVSLLHFTKRFVIVS